jgi:transcriptional enhancer factor
MGPPRTVVHIDIVPDDTPTTPVRSFEREVIGEEQQWPSMGGGIVRASQHPRPIHCIDPTITLLSNSPISARSVFQVISSGMTVFSETTPLSPAGPAPEAASGALLYKTTLVPGFWDKISNSSDPTQYVIVQDVIQDGPTSSSTMFSAVYKFSYCRSGDSDHQFLPSPMMDQHDNGAKFASNQPMVSFDNLLAMDSTSFGDLMDYESFDTYFNFGHLDIKGCMDPRSPSELSVGSAAGYEPLAFGDERDHYNQLPVSPMSACFPPGLSNYVS